MPTYASSSEHVPTWCRWVGMWDCYHGAAAVTRAALLLLRASVWESHPPAPRADVAWIKLPFSYTTFTALRSKVKLGKRMLLQSFSYFIFKSLLSHSFWKVCFMPEDRVGEHKRVIHTKSFIQVKLILRAHIGNLRVKTLTSTMWLSKYTPVRS